jgi:hypothetical protein
MILRTLGRRVARGLRSRFMPVEFLSDEQVAAYGRFTGELPAGELERFFYLDDADRDLVARRRSDHHRLGFASVRAVSRRARGRTRRAGDPVRAGDGPEAPQHSTASRRPPRSSACLCRRRGRRRGPPLPSSPLLGGMLSGRNGSRALSIAPMTSS